METKEHHAQQADVAARPGRLSSTTRGPLGTLTLIAFLGYVLMYFVGFFIVLFVEGIFFLPMLIFAIFTLLVAGIVATGFRWAPLLGAGVSLATAAFVFLQPEEIYVLTHPAHPLFNVFVPMAAFGLVTLVAGVGATVQNYRGLGYEPRLPRWSPMALSGLAGIVVGIGLVSLLVSTVPQTSAASSRAHGEPTVHMTANQFAQNVVLVPKGSKLLLVNDGSVEHILQNGAWDASGSPHPAAEPGAPTLHNVDITNGSAEIGPFATAGVYHIYCTLHQSMNLTVVVE
jgi:plastocyanin